MKTNEALAKNKEAILKALKDLGANTVTVPYDGSGDDGSVGQPVGDVSLSSVHISVTVMHSSFSKTTKKWHSEGREVAKPLDEAIQDYCYDMLELKHPGWEINEGSSGEFTFNLEIGTIVLSHDENIISTNNYREQL